MHIKSYKKDGKTFYMFQGYAGVDPATGKRIRLTRRGFKSHKEAELEFYRLQLQIQAEGYQKVKKYTYKEVYELWLEEYKNTVKESTLHKTETNFRIHILPLLGSLNIELIKVTHCQKAINTWFGKVKNYRCMNSYCGLVFKHAMKLGIINEDPTKLITIPVRLDEIEEQEAEGNYFTKEELTAFLNGIGTNRRWKTFFHVLAFSGCRKGELLALTWDDVDFKNSQINVNKTLTYGLGNKLIVQTPKTKKSKRVIPMDPGTMQLLKDWKSCQAEMMLKFGFNTLKPKQLVFTNTKNTFIPPQKIGRILNEYCDRIHLRRITPHGFRHTHCSILFEAGASLKEVQERLGHSDIHTTMNIYAHVTKEKKEETAMKFANFLGL